MRVQNTHVHKSTSRFLRFVKNISNFSPISEQKIKMFHPNVNTQGITLIPYVGTNLITV